MNDDDILEDVKVDFSTYSRLTSEASQMIKKSSHDKGKSRPVRRSTEDTSEKTVETPVERPKKKAPEFDVKRDFEDRFTGVKRLDIGCGKTREEGWIGLDNDDRFCPHLKMDARAMLLRDQSVDEARALYSLSCIENPELVLQETWRVLRPNSLLTIVEGMPGADLTLFPGVRHVFTKEYWRCVTETDTYSYVPLGARGCWRLETPPKYSLNNIGQRLAWKLKLTWGDTADAFRNVATQQVVVLKKIVS